LGVALMTIQIWGCHCHNDDATAQPSKRNKRQKETRGKAQETIYKKTKASKVRTLSHPLSDREVNPLSYEAEQMKYGNRACVHIGWHFILHGFEACCEYVDEYAEHVTIIHMDEHYVCNHDAALVMGICMLWASRCLRHNGECDPTTDHDCFDTVMCCCFSAIIESVGMSVKGHGFDPSQKQLFVSFWCCFFCCKNTSHAHHNTYFFFDDCVRLVP
jgi:hypothetical protein